MLQDSENCEFSMVAFNKEIYVIEISRLCLLYLVYLLVSPRKVGMFRYTVFVVFVKGSAPKIFAICVQKT